MPRDALLPIAALLVVVATLSPASVALVSPPVHEVDLPCDELAAAPPAQGALCGTWDRRADLPTGAREGLGLAWLEVAGRALAFGGRDANGAPAGDLWSYDPGANAWTQLASGPPRADAAFVADEASNVAFLFGGRDATGPRQDVWRFDYAANTWTPLAPDAASGPSPRYGMAAAWDQTRARITVFGGTDGAQTFGDFWSLVPGSATWTALAGGPAARRFPNAVWDQARQGLIFQGGEAADGAELADAWFFPTVQQAWSRMPDASPRARGAAAWDFNHAFLHVFGGVTGGVASDESHLLIPSRELWLTETDLPSARTGAAGAYDLNGRVCLVAGGVTATGPTAEFWAFTPATWAAAF
ncbi:MAG TPA: kelch repeat-containing protein [Candidatus Thermoplasmatota archaeon]|jgi:hypothetical protein|nr:kelch repeat-containing protein [Candidatus Thermoplasmatota archaeon]